MSYNYYYMIILVTTTKEYNFIFKNFERIGINDEPTTTHQNTNLTIKSTSTSETHVLSVTHYDYILLYILLKIAKYMIKIEKSFFTIRIFFFYYFCNLCFIFS